MSALKPDVDGTHDLGTTALRWRALHVDSITTATAAQGGTDCTVGTNLVVTGNLTVNGDTTTLSTTNLIVEDKTITLANGAADSAAADGAGISIDGASATFLYDDTGTQWELNKPLEVQGNVLPQADATHDLGSTTLGWNDLHLGSGGVINFSNGDVTATHSANLLTITGGNTRVDRLEIDSAADYIDVDTDLTLTASAGIVLDAVSDIVLDADGDDITFKAGAGDTTGLKWSQSNSGDWTNLVGTQDKDLIFQVNDGGAATEVMRLDGDVSSLLMAGTKKITFGDAGSFIHQSADGKLAMSSDGASADAVVIVASDNAGGIDIDAGTGGIAIDSTGALAISVAGNSTISTTGTGTLTIDSAGALVIDTDGTDSISLGVEAAAKTITIGNDASTKVDVNALAIELDSAGSVVIDSVTTTDIDAAGILSLNSSAAAINIGNDAVAQPINIGTGAAARTITVGEDASTKVDINALSIELDAGTSGFAIDGAAASSVTTSAGALTISGNAGLNLQEDGLNVIAIDTNRDVLFSQTGGSTGDPDVEFDGYVRFDGASEFDGAVQVDGTLTANAAVSVQSTLTVGVDDTGYDVKLFGATSGQYLLWDESADELVLAGDSKLSFHDAAGGENIIASADGHLEVNAGTTLDMTAPTVDINASTAVTVNSPSIVASSSSALSPVLELKNTANDADGARLKFVKDKGAAGAQGDDAGIISFYADNATQTSIEFARITAEVQTATNLEEGGKLTLSVAEHDGTMTPGLVLTEGSTDGVIDVTIGAGSGSTTTIAGNLTVSGTTTTVNSTELTVADDLITVSKGNDTVANANGSGLEIEVSTGTNLHWKYVHARTALSANTDIDVDTGKVFRINGTEVLSADGSAKVQSGVAGAGLSHADGVLALDIDELDALGGTGIDQSDHFVFSDAGTEKKITFSNLEDAIFGNVSGDATIAAGGALTIAASSVEGTMLNNNVISGRGEHTGVIDDTDEFLISDAGIVKRTDFSVLRDAVFADVSGDATVAAGGALTIAASSVENSMLVNDHITVAGDSGSQDIHLNDTLTISGTAGEIETSVTGDTITIGLPDNVDIDGTLTVASSSNLNGSVIVDTNGGATFRLRDVAGGSNKFVVAANGDTTISGKLTVSGVLESDGTNLEVKDALVQIGSTGVGAFVDTGIYSTLSTNENIGLIWDRSDSRFKLYESLDDPESEEFTFSTGTASTLELGQIYLKDAAEDGGSGVATPLTTHATYYVTAAAETSTLAAGSEGQVKVLAMKTNGGDMVVTVTNAAWGGSGTVTLSAQGQACTLQYIDSQWYCIGNNGCAFA